MTTVLSNVEIKRNPFSEEICCKVTDDVKLKNPVCSFSWPFTLDEFLALDSPSQKMRLCAQLPYNTVEKWRSIIEATSLLGFCSVAFIENQGEDDERDVFSSIQIDFPKVPREEPRIKGVDYEEKKKPKLMKNESDYISPLEPQSHSVLFSALKERFNYASTDCAASILSAPKGSSFPSSILNSNKDQYMLTPCKSVTDQSSKEIVIELCQDIQIKHVLLANLEYFSSMIRHFKLFINNRYPGDLKHPWTWIGSFETLNTRESQVRKKQISENILGNSSLCRFSM